MGDIQDISELERNVLENRQQVSDNYFPADRGLRRKSRLGGRSYHAWFRNYFLDSLKQLGPDDIWMNIGAGELFAEYEYEFSEEFSGKARVVSVSVADPNTEGFRDNLKSLDSTGRFQYLTGRRIEDIPNAELPKPTLLSDLFGAMGFSEHVDETLQKELDLLKREGTLITRFESIYIRDEADRRFGHKRYLDRIKGVEIIYHGFQNIILRKKSDNVEVPKLELVKFLSYKNAPNPKGLADIYVNSQRFYVLKE